MGVDWLQKTTFYLLFIIDIEEFHVGIKPEREDKNSKFNKLSTKSNFQLYFSFNKLNKTFLLNCTISFFFCHSVLQFLKIKIGTMIISNIKGKSSFEVFNFLSYGALASLECKPMSF